MSDKKDFDRNVKLLIKLFLKKKAVPLGYGRHKATFAHGNYVYRIPISLGAFDELFVEANISKAAKQGFFIWDDGDSFILPAKTRIITIMDIPVQVMEKLVPVARYSTGALEENWLKHLERCGDGKQVGRDKNGIIKAFDFSDVRDCLGRSDPIVKDAVERANALVNKFTGDRWTVECSYLSNVGLEYTPGNPDSFFLEKRKEAFTFT
jgi:hypothetical protein